MVWNGHNYFLSWREPWHKFEDWDWFNGRNFCRDRCMDLVSFDTPGEFQLFAGIMRQGGLALSRIKSLSLASLHFFTNSNIGTTLAGTKQSNPEWTRCLRHYECDPKEPGANLLSQSQEEIFPEASRNLPAKEVKALLSVKSVSFMNVVQRTRVRILGMEIPLDKKCDNYFIYRSNQRHSGLSFYHRDPSIHIERAQAQAGGCMHANQG